MQKYFAFLIALSWMCISDAVQAAEDVVKAADAGFQLTIPDVDWEHRVQPGDGELNAIYVEPASAGGRIQFSVRVSAVIDVDTESAQSDTNQIREYIAANTGFSEVEDLVLDVGGQPASGLRLIQSAFEEEFRVHLVFLHSRGMRYRFQFHAPRDEFDKNWNTAQQILTGFEFIDLDESAREQSRLRQLAARCGSQINWAADWNQAAERARQERRLIVVSIYAQPGFALGNQLNESVFMSSDIIKLIEHRFVALRWNRGQTALFVSHDVFGLSASTFGAGLLVCTPDGEVVRQIYYLRPVLVADGLRRALEQHSEFAPSPAAPSTQPAEAAAFLIDSGQLNAAQQLLGERRDSESAAIYLQRVRLHRINREGEAALQALEAAKRNEDSTLEVRLLLEEAATQIGLGHLDAANATLRRCMNNAPNDIERAEVMLLLGVLAWAKGDVPRAREQWTSLTRELPEQPPAWAAAAALLGPALDLEITPDLSWPTKAAELVAVLPDPEPESTSLDIAPTLVRAVDWLLEAQRPDGGWDTRFSIGDTHPAPSSIAMAVQAIDTLAMFRAAQYWHQHHESERAARCLEASTRALRRFLDDRKLARENPRPVAFMDYTCWGSSYGLFCLTSFLNADLNFGDGALSEVSRAEIRAEVAHLISDLLRIQAGNGGWSYYLSGEVDGDSVGAAMSFTTATVLLALQSAQDAGFDVPEISLNRGYACLASLRGSNGVFAYMRQGEGPFSAGVVDPGGAAARGPICALALRRAGQLDADAMMPVFKTYAEYLSGFTAEARKALMHAGTSGQGSHYLLYDYSTAAEALRATSDDALDADTRDHVRTAILNGLARCRNADGSFVDNPIIGCSAGTGLAVFTLLDLLGNQTGAENK